MRTRPDRRVVTFYSYKGGAGRTTALANVAWRLADKHGLRVIVVDWDLEAPGLHAFFGIPAEEAARANGVLDFLLAWRDALQAGASAPPEVSPLPITKRPYAPRRGSLAVVPAGRLDDGYDARLASFDWRTFYRETAGAAAVETLRKQLAGAADLVLVDSRTGLTDAGGICTIQLPDGIVLMAAPNEQSIQGITRIARGIAKAPADERAGRERPRVWVSVCRGPEDSALAPRWFDAHREWFDKGVEEGLWRKEDHRLGIRSFRIPFAGRWAFGEPLLHDAAEVEDDDVLALAYVRLGQALEDWAGVVAPIEVRPQGSARDLEAAKQRVAEAEAKGDMRDLAWALSELTEMVRERLAELEQAKRAAPPKARRRKRS
jgi:MinD-like ATPase involved in chromosome partitioning or flagellar assembly